MLDSGQRTETVLVVGWGFIGAALGERLLKAGRSVVGLTRSENRRTKLGRRAGARIAVGDAADAAVVSELVAGVDHVVFAAGGLTPLSSAIDPAREAAAFLLPLIAVLEALRGHPGVRFTFISSGGTVYGEPATVPTAETAQIHPISQYGVTCAAGEMYVRMYSASFGVSAQVVRCSNVYGPGQPHDRGQGAVAVFLHRVAHGLPIAITGDGTATRDYIYVDDVAYVLESLLSAPTDAGVINVGSGVGHTVLDVLDVAERVVGRKADVTFVGPLRHDVQSIVLDISKLQSLLPFTPTPFEQGVRLTHAAGSASSAGEQPRRSLRRGHAFSAG